MQYKFQQYVPIFRSSAECWTFLLGHRGRNVLCQLCSSTVTPQCSQFLVWLSTRPLLRHVRCHSVVADLVADLGSGMVMAGFACDGTFRAVFPPRMLAILASMALNDSYTVGDDTIRAVFPWVGDRPEMLGVLVGMDQEDRYAARLSRTQLQLIDKVVYIPVTMQRPFLMVQTVWMTTEIPQSLFDKVLDVPVTQVMLVVFNDRCLGSRMQSSWTRLCTCSLSACRALVVIVPKTVSQLQFFEFYDRCHGPDGAAHRLEVLRCSSSSRSSISPSWR